MRFRKSAHSVYKTEYHVVWTPRYRRSILVQGVKQYLEQLLRSPDNLEEDIEVIRVSTSEAADSVGGSSLIVINVNREILDFSSPQALGGKIGTALLSYCAHSRCSAQCFHIRSGELSALALCAWSLSQRSVARSRCSAQCFLSQRSVATALSIRQILLSGVRMYKVPLESLAELIMDAWPILYVLDRVPVSFDITWIRPNDLFIR